MDLISTLVLVPDRQLLQFGGDVVSRPTIGVPIGVVAVVGGRSSSRLGIGLEVLLKAVPAHIGLMAFLLAHLADWFGRRRCTSLRRQRRVGIAAPTLATTSTTTATTAAETPTPA